MLVVFKGRWIVFKGTFEDTSDPLPLKTGKTAPTPPLRTMPLEDRKNLQ